MRGMKVMLVLGAFAMLALGCEQKTQREEYPPVDVGELGVEDSGMTGAGAGATSTTTPLPPAGLETPTDVTPLPPPPPAPTPTPVSQTYVMKRGDTLWSVAARFYGDGKLWTKIRDANNIRDINDIPTGTVLNIPPK